MLQYAKAWITIFFEITKNDGESLLAGMVSCVPQKTHSQQAMTKVKYVLVPDVK
jgi:hypothetical protein